MTLPFTAWRGLAGLLLLALAAALAGCATALPTVDRAAIESSALPGSPGSPLGRIVAASTPEGQHSGFRLLPMGPFSYDTRLQQARLAAVSLDLQYYHFEADAAAPAPATPAAPLAAGAARMPMACTGKPCSSSTPSIA